MSGRLPDNIIFPVMDFRYDCGLLFIILDVHIHHVTDSQGIRTGKAIHFIAPAQTSIPETAAIIPDQIPGACGFVNFSNHNN
jgi:hypothetical protein